MNELANLRESLFYLFYGILLPNTSNGLNGPLKSAFGAFQNWDEAAQLCYQACTWLTSNTLTEIN